MFSSSSSGYVSSPHKRNRSDENDHDAAQRGGVRKFSRRIVPHTVAPLARIQDSPEINSSPRSEIVPLQLEGRLSPLFEGEEEENWVDEKSVESILEGVNPLLVGTNADESVNPFWDGDSLPPSPEQVEVVDDAGEKHRRYSFDSKGKGKALV